MSIFLKLAFLFFIGSIAGWVIELLFRRFISTANSERKWINPGFCMGPYLPLYGCGLCVLYLLASLEKYEWIADPIWNKVVLFVLMAVGMTVIEYFAGLISLKLAKVRLWDYSDEWGNIQGIICPRFSLIWAALGAVYYFFIHPLILDALKWLSNNLAFSFVVGMFFGIFVIDVIYSAQLVAKLKKFAEDNDIIVRYEHFKEHVRTMQIKAKHKPRFLFLRPDRPISEYLKEYKITLEALRKKYKK
ncbi:MAG: putative ABC transporter permease [Clostridia bacterium]|nr:putative ABC transporter permease [Clostridia bacterium]